MNDTTRAVRTTAAVIVTAGLAMLAAACGSAPSSAGARSSPHTSGPAASPGALAYSACMRSHGAPNYPDPDSSGQLPKTSAQLLGISSAQYQAAQQDCQNQLPIGQQDAQCMENDNCSPAVVQQILTADRNLARCMRSHGVPNFPDPANGGPGGAYFPISTVGISDAQSRTPQFMAALNECGRLTGDNAPESFG